MRRDIATEECPRAPGERRRDGKRQNRHHQPEARGGLSELGDSSRVHVQDVLLDFMFDIVVEVRQVLLDYGLMHMFMIVRGSGVKRIMVQMNMARDKDKQYQRKHQQDAKRPGESAKFPYAVHGGGVYQCVRGLTIALPAAPLPGSSRCPATRTRIHSAGLR